MQAVEKKSNLKKRYMMSNYLEKHGHVSSLWGTTEKMNPDSELSSEIQFEPLMFFKSNG